MRKEKQKTLIRILVSCEMAIMMRENRNLPANVLATARRFLRQRANHSCFDARALRSICWNVSVYMCATIARRMRTPNRRRSPISRPEKCRIWSVNEKWNCFPNHIDKKIFAKKVLHKCIYPPHRFHSIGLHATTLFIVVNIIFGYYLCNSNRWRFIRKRFLWVEDNKDISILSATQPNHHFAHWT